MQGYIIWSKIVSVGIFLQIHIFFYYVEMKLEKTVLDLFQNFYIGHHYKAKGSTIMMYNLNCICILLFSCFKAFC